MIWVAGALLLLAVLTCLELGFGMRRIERLADLPARDPEGAPHVTIVAAARDEATMIEPAVRSMLGMRYPSFQIVVVNDRSTDATGAILDRLAAKDPRLLPVHVAELPPGWLGKNHALQVGADCAAGEWILFTDADIHMHPEALSRAMRYAEFYGVDHLAATPSLEMPGVLLKGFSMLFLFIFASFAKPWRARNPNSWFHVGVGAFNLVRRSAYEGVGGHSRIALRPDDDMKLAKILKRGGYRADLVDGSSVLRVEWYQSLPEMVRAFEKNMFAGLDYNVLLSVVGGLLQLALTAIPLIGVLVTTGIPRLLLGAQVALSVAVFAYLAKRIRVSPLVALTYPLVSGLFVFILWRTMVLNLSEGGLQWRGTFYPLKLLKANRV